jgi:hypothetical protein
VPAEGPQQQERILDWQLVAHYATEK